MLAPDNIGEAKSHSGGRILELEVEVSAVEGGGMEGWDGGCGEWERWRLPISGFGLRPTTGDR